MKTTLYIHLMRSCMNEMYLSLSDLVAELSATLARTPAISLGDTLYSKKGIIMLIRRIFAIAVMIYGVFKGWILFGFDLDSVWILFGYVWLRLYLL